MSIKLEIPFPHGTGTSLVTRPSTPSCIFFVLQVLFKTKLNEVGSTWMQHTPLIAENVLQSRKVIF